MPFAAVIRGLKVLSIVSCAFLPSATSICLGADDTADSLRLKALDGDVAAMRKLGEYYMGCGKPSIAKPNRTEAAKWFRSAARKGDIASIRRLVESKLPVEREERMRWLWKMETEAGKLPRDEKFKVLLSASEEYTRLDQKRSIDCLFELCNLIEQDWGKLRPDKIAFILRGEGIGQERDDYRRGMIKTGLQADFPSHIKFLKLAIEKDLPRNGSYSYNILLRTLSGEAYERGLGVAQNLDEAYKRYADAVAYAKKHPCKESWESSIVGYAQRRLGECLRYGKGCKRDLAEAVKWYEKAALNKDLEARNQYADWCFDGLVEVGSVETTAKTGAATNVPAAIPESKTIGKTIIEPDVRRAEELSNPHDYSYWDEQEVLAAYRLCRIYIARDDWAAAVESLKKWHKYEKSPCRAKMKYLLASAYLRGKGVKEDKETGLKLLEEAARLGEPESMMILDNFGREY